MSEAIDSQKLDKPLLYQSLSPIKKEESVDNDENLFFVARAAKYFDIPFSPGLFFTIRGAENFHIYLWLAKDFSWMQDWYYPSIVFGILAVSWCTVLLYIALTLRNYEEAFFLLPLVCWLFGNFWWMSGEVINNDDAIRQPEGGDIMIAGIAFFALYILVLKPLNVLTMNVNVARKYNDAGLVPYFKIFPTWRHYEHFHELCWLCKDLSWNMDSPVLWSIFCVPTVIIALDFIVQTARNPRLIIDCVHYTAQFFWVMANFTWACGELWFGNQSDIAYSIFDFSRSAVNLGRWYASWMIVLAFLPIIALYVIWLPLSFLGAIEEEEVTVAFAPVPLRESFEYDVSPIVSARSSGVRSSDVDEVLRGTGDV